MKIKRLLTLLLIILMVVAAVPSTVSASAIKLNKTKATIEVGKSTTLKVNGTEKAVKWSSSNKKVATVNSKGKVKGISEGNATITATVSSKTYKATVTVKDAEVEVILRAYSQDGMTIEEYIEELKNDDKDHVYKKYDDEHYIKVFKKTEYNELIKTDWLADSITSMKENEMSNGVLINMDVSKDYKSFKLYVDESKYDFTHAFYFIFQCGIISDLAQSINLIKPEDRSINLSIINYKTKEVIYSN